MYKYFAKDATALSETLPEDRAAAPASPNEALSRLLDLARHLLDVPVAVVCFLDTPPASQRYAARGLAADAPTCPSPFCKAVLEADGLLLIEDVKTHASFAHDPLLTTAEARFGAGAIIQTNGHPTGVLALLDTRPRTLSQEQQQTLHHLAGLAADQPSLYQQALDGREARYQAYFEQSVEGIWCYAFVPPVSTALPIEEQIQHAYANARLVECNDAMAHMYGYDNAADLAHDDPARRLPPYAEGNFEAVKAFFEAGYRATEVETVEYDRYGNARCFSNNVVGIIENGHMVRVWGSQTDITERWWAEDALRKSEQLLSSINENISEAIYRSTPAGDLLYANDAMVQMFGYASAQEMMDGHVVRFYHDPQRRGQLMARTEKEHGFKGEEVKFVRKDGSTFWGLISCNVTLDDGGAIVTYDGAISDITKRKRYEQSLIEAKEQALEMARLKSAFLADMSHEIRTPLTSIIGCADILAEEAPEAHRELVQLIQQSGDRLVQTLQSVLDLARLEGETPTLNAEQIDAVVLARQVLDLFRLQAQQRGLDLRLTAPDAPLTVRLDAGALSRILTNLVSNAIKFTKEGHVAVILEATTLEEQGDALEIRVEDTGTGISKDFMPSVFSEFRQEASMLAANAPGSGLGLAITKRLVALLGGSIEVESEKGRGSVFTVRLPRGDD